MNRQFRRAQEKQDKRQQKEKTRRREERRSKVREMRKARKEKSDKQPASKGESTADRPAPRGRVPGRFAGVLAAVTVFFITLQSAAPVEQDESLGASLIGAGFYLMLGYFATLWFMRRGTPRAPLVSIVGGILLAASVSAAQVIQDQPIDILALALVIPALIIGTLLGRLVFVATPR